MVIIFRESFISTSEHLIIPLPNLMYDCIVEESVRSCVAQGGVGCHMDVVVVAVAHLEHVNMTCDTFYLSHAIHSTCHMLILSSPDQTACQPPEGCRGSG